MIVVTAISSTSTSRGKDQEEFGTRTCRRNWRTICGSGSRCVQTRCLKPLFADAKGGFMDTGNYRRRVLEAFMRWGSTH